MFAALKTHNYRLWASGQIVSLVGTWMQRVAQDWLVLTLSGGNGFAVGIVMALQFGPTLFLSVWGGVLADRYDKRKLLMITQVFAAVCGLVLGVLDVGGMVELWHVYVIAFVLGCSSAIDAPVRQSFTIEMVGKETLANAIALNSMTFNMARIVGPAVSGVLITLVGTGWVFLINAVSFAAVFGALVAMNVGQLFRVEPAPRAKGQVREGFRYVWGRGDLRVLLATVFMVSTFGLNFPLSLSVLARNTFGSGADAYGLLSTTLAVGTLAGATLAARRASAPRLRLFIGAVIAFGAFELIVGLMPNYLLVALLLIPTGALTLTFTTSAMNILQMSVPSDMRGRVMGIYMLCFLGGTPLGSPVLGWLADVLDPRAPLVFGGVISLATGLFAAVYLLRHNNLRITVVPPADGHRLPTLDTVAATAKV
ncbi:MFS transporter [Rhodococcus sp. 15-725-2-2b]|jgi:MFS family permease|uniref:MFS transporter n=1 Tax=unclassified Rhodococcus (in: high G+C Gram-positive bacteria) TaxID=192944 RepID=UPI000B9B5AD3|nr:MULTISPECIES: MFS transporter [unclassified Rhodococcus (in: high G+C Gram-positive bacteria)]OZC66958.1 MFS transporter [Rhodococcus sp. 06-470-2]OZC72753.1 MFS transporter [Rhodococcus sp. 06-469-3-2]OZC76752.1 MFS transporter [Rhodococcus sp. 06-418-5]OZD48980.1 MFS transporter [Rhodococcus sp. 06-1477-1A]OZE03100.1 MFS transporter [Rhodococcus sp. 05-2255-3C]